ncbi:MAG TPA: GAF domain-containing sensor histidine kinase [Symbiobacteriaceae bacterium]|nr:GAF domain-containing sensor histidine kinase [Symbiobacteriaceae bacterium]
MKSNELTILFDQHFRLTAVSGDAARLLGRTEIIGLVCREALGCPECPGTTCPLHQARAGNDAEGIMPVSGPSGPATVAVSAGPARLGGEKAILMRLVEQEAADDAHQAEGPMPVLHAGLRGVLDGLRDILQSDLTALAFYDENRREVRWQVTSGNISPALTDIRLRPGQGFAGRIVMTSLPLATTRFADLTSDPDSYPIFLQEGLEGAIGVPVMGRDRVLGVLMAASRQPRAYTERDIRVLTQIAGSVSLAAEMSRLYSKAADAERARLAQEVHDGLSQNLFGLQLLITNLRESIAGESPEEVERALQQICRVLDGTLSEVRHLIADLRGATEPDQGLVACLSDYLAYFCRFSRLQVELALRIPQGSEVSCQAPHEVLRIAQEALMNVYRHAGARRVRVELAAAPGGYTLAITDDGRGFDPGAPPPAGHFGLAIMRERADRFQGAVLVSSSPGRGTEVRVSIPHTAVEGEDG